jgi:hypothetical protein
MKIKHSLLLLTLVAMLVTMLTGFSWPWFSRSNNTPLGSNTWMAREVQVLKSQARNIDDRVLRLALTAYTNARKHGYVGKQVLTVIDYSKPSTEKRLWVFDLQHNRTLFNTWVSHGKNSGGVNSTSFSNSPGSLKSSLGVFVTDTTYDGKNGYSLRLRGLERGVNDSAYSRAIVVHGAAYANPYNHSNYGIGRSWGCPAVEPRLAAPIINSIKNQSILFAYYPDRRWMSSSRFLSA